MMILLSVFFLATLSVMVTLVSTKLADRPEALTSSQGSVFYYNSEHRLVPEKNDQLSLLHFLYGTRAGKYSRFFLSSRFVHKMIEYYVRSALSKRHIKSFIADHSIAMELYQVPAEGFASFHDFFIRELAPEKKKIERAALVSPAFGKLLLFDPVQLDSNLCIKKSHGSVRQFFNHFPGSEQFDQGTLFAIRLAPADYHRFHFPCDAIPGEPVSVAGGLDSVNPIVFGYGAQPWLSNERKIIPLYAIKNSTIQNNQKINNRQNQSDQLIALMMPVGALFVGSIQTTYIPGKCYRAGDEAGYFTFGGSSILLLWNDKKYIPKKKYLEQSLVAGEAHQGASGQKILYETEVAFGEALVEKRGL